MLTNRMSWTGDGKMAALLRCVGLVVLACLAASCASLPPPAPKQQIQGAPSTPVQAVPTPLREQPSARATPAGARQPASAWKTNQAALGIIEKSEDVRLVAYPGEGSAWYIGYGHKKDITPGMMITQTQAEAFLLEDARSCESQVVRAVTVPVTENEFSAMVSICFTSPGAVGAQSSIIKFLNAGDRLGAADAFLLYIMSGGMVNRGLSLRRRKERDLFLQ
jgi:lysozyme